MHERVLIVEDDPNIARLTSSYLKKHFFEPEIAPTGRQAMDAVKSATPDLILLDLMLPDIDGLAICKYVRSFSDVPIIMLTAKGEVTDRVIGLQLGCDDYLVKPFDPLELIERIRAVLRRSEKKSHEGHSPVENVLRAGNLMLDPLQYTVTLDQNRVELPKREYDLLQFFMRHPNQVFSRDQLIENIWGWDFEGEDRVVDLYIKRLRDRLTGEAQSIWKIVTVRGTGYKFEVNHT